MFRPLRKGMLYLGALLFSVAFLNVAWSAPAPASTTSGVEGTAFSTGCPAQRIGQRCSWPLAGVKITIAGHQAISDKRGHFRIGLIPGSWRLTAVAVNVGPEHVQRRSFRVTVKPNRWRKVTIIFSNGIA